MEMDWYSLRVISGKEKSIEMSIMREVDEKNISGEIEEVYGEIEESYSLTIYYNYYHKNAHDLIEKKESDAKKPIKYLNNII